MTPRPDLPRPDPARPDRRKALARGNAAEALAALYFMSKGYRILARRYKTPVGEIDLIARRGRRIAFVEVKQRPARELCEAAVTSETRRRVHRAADWWLARHEGHQALDLGFDCLFIVPWRWPMHFPDAL
ncbi:MAG: YraN family protein [Hyphomicrobium sp.]